MKHQESLGEFVKQLATLMHQKQVKMPFRNERPWHLLFYELKTAQGRPGKPAFFERLRFDWDGPYPKSRELSQFLQALHWNASVSASNPHYDTITLPPVIADLWSQRLAKVDEETRAFLDEAVQRGRMVFSQTVDEAEPADAKSDSA